MLKITMHLVLSLAVLGCVANDLQSDNIVAGVQAMVENRTIEMPRLHTASDIKLAYDQKGMDPDQMLLLFMNALLLLEENEKEGMAAGAYLSRSGDRLSDKQSPTGVMPTKMRQQSEFSRLIGNKNIARSYVGGVSGTYELVEKEKIILDIKEVRDLGTQLKYFLYTTGKDNPSPITIAKEGNMYVMVEWSSITTGIKK